VTKANPENSKNCSSKCAYDTCCCCCASLQYPLTLALIVLLYRLSNKLYFIFAIDIVSYCDFLASSSAIDVDRPLTSCTCCFGPVGAPSRLMTSYGREKAITLVSTDVNVQKQATLEVTLASVRIDVAVASSLVLVVVSRVEMSIRVHRTPLGIFDML